MTQDSFQLNSAAISDRGLSQKRPHNEDSYLEMSARGLFVVADGVGGAQAGDVASQMAVEILGEAFTNLREGGDVEELMKRAIEHANGAIFQMSHDLAQLSTMATTIVALQVTGNIATIGHVGDSRLYRLDSRGQLFRETQDHSVVEEEVRAGRMTPAQAANHPSRNVISRALGAEQTVEVDMKTIMIEPNTTFLLCSDGITRHIEDHEIRDLLVSMPIPSEICARMKDICYSRGAEDNLTAVIVKVGSSAVEATNGKPHDFEESTIASARPAAASSSAAFANSDDDDFEIPTQNLQMPAENKSAARDSDKTEQISAADTAEPSTPAENTAETVNYQTPQAETASAPVVKDEKTYTIDKDKGGSFLGKFLTACLLLILGGIVGAALYHFLAARSQPQPQIAVQETPRLTEMRTPNIEYSAFEDNRRNVDRNPEQFISTGGASAQDAEGLYLLGRAYFVMGDYVKAKDAFTRARNQLSEVREINRPTLENEIAVGLSIVENNIARNEFINQKRLISSPPQNPANTANTANTMGNQ
ncbi:MAG: protein phosphatase 2C domain-containing protein [Acidobacteriota bacterium]|nr:protein phosphatase 2C domain-containing protein [Acidobacteriota bacterium]